jgi:predicted nucleotide-binding protein (sugar kinase/HSP70/actin superfamily)
VTLHRQILDREGYPDVPILAPSSYMGYAGLEEPIRRQIFKAMLVGDILMKAGCKVRPYERVAGETNYCLERRSAQRRCSRRTAISRKRLAVSRPHRR